MSLDEAHMKALFDEHRVMFAFSVLTPDSGGELRLVVRFCSQIYNSIDDYVRAADALLAYHKQLVAMLTARKQ